MRHGNLRAPLVFLGVYGLLTLAASTMGEAYVVAWLPLLKLESQWLLPHGLLADSMSIVIRQAQRLVELHATTTTNLAFGKGVVPAALGLKSSTLEAYVLFHPVLIYSTLAAWPIRSWRARIAVFLLGVPCVLVTTSLDIPFVLAGLLQDLILEHVAPERLGSDPLAIYYAFMHGGGRVGLAIVGAVITALAATRVHRMTTARPITRIGRNVKSSAQKIHRVAVTGR